MIGIVAKKFGNKVKLGLPKQKHTSNSKRKTLRQDAVKVFKILNIIYNQGRRDLHKDISWAHNLDPDTYVDPGYAFEELLPK